MVFFIFSFLIQVLLIVKSGIGEWWVLLGQFEYLFICLLVLMAKNRWVTFLAMIFLCFNFLYFKIFHQHLNLVDISRLRLTDLDYIMASFMMEIDLWFMLGVLVSFLFFRFPRKIKIPHKYNSIFYGLFFLFMGSSYVFKYYTFPSKITSHPMLSLFNLSGREVKQDLEINISRVRMPMEPADMSIGEKLIFKKQSFEISKTEKNTILIILESVGSVQMMKEGGINKEAFPFLHSIEKHGILFDRIYSQYPGTTRSHMAINSGMAPTKSSLFDFSKNEFFGPSIAKIFKSKHYYTMLISAMGLRFEDLDHFYSSSKFDYVFDPDKVDTKIKRINPWGIDEKVALRIALEKIKQVDGQQFYLQFLTNSTHYPYLISENKNLKSNKDRYILACNYTDSIIADLIEGLKNIGMLRNTRIFITGDHGEAFGEIHAQNVTHRNYLYEENIRNFLLILDLDFDFVQGPILNSRIGSIADIMPTIFSFKESLLNPIRKDETQFFHKNSSPAQFGLVDGDFKYISTLNGSKQEIYWLRNDPHEKVNLKNLYPNKMKYYYSLTKEWFESQDNLYRSYNK